MAMDDRTITPARDRWELKTEEGELTEGWAKDACLPVGMGPSQFCSHQALGESNPALLVTPSPGVNGQFLQQISGGQTSEELMQSVVFVLPVELEMIMSVDATQGIREDLRGKPVVHRLLRVPSC